MSKRSGSISVVGAADEGWVEALAASPMADVYFSPEYHRIFEEYEGNTAELFVFRRGARFVAYPYMRRDLGGVEQLSLEGEKLYDITSAYGYGGPFWSKDAPDEGMWREFGEAFGSYCRSEGIVSEFVRFHPLARNHAAYADAERRNRTVYVDLTVSEEELRGGFSAANRRNIRKAERSGLEFAEVKWEDCGSEFHRLYAETMERVEASDFYFFPISFFESHFRILGESAHLFGVFCEGELAAGAICMSYGSFFHYHFGCSSEAHLGSRPNNLLFAEMIRWAKERGLRVFHLGGGYEEGDSLFRFKGSFSARRADFFTCSRVHRLEDYEHLVRMNDERIAREGRRLSAREKEFFPAYRR